MKQRKFNYCFFTFLGFWVGVLAQDIAHFTGNMNTVTMEDFAISAFMIFFHVLGLYLTNYLLADNPIEELVDEDQLNRDPDHECKLCGSPVKEGDGIDYYGDKYCTLEHFKEAKA